MHVKNAHWSSTRFAAYCLPLPPIPPNAPIICCIISGFCCICAIAFAIAFGSDIIFCAISIIAGFCIMLCAICIIAGLLSKPPRPPGVSAAWRSAAAAHGSQHTRQIELRRAQQHRPPKARLAQRRDLIGARRAHVLFCELERLLRSWIGGIDPQRSLAARNCLFVALERQLRVRQPRMRFYVVRLECDGCGAVDAASSYRSRWLSAAARLP